MVFRNRGEAKKAGRRRKLCVEVEEELFCSVACEELDEDTQDLSL